MDSDAVVSHEAVDGEHDATWLANEGHVVKELLKVVAPWKIIGLSKSQNLEVVGKDSHVDCGLFLSASRADVDEDEDDEVHYDQDCHSCQSACI